MKLDYGMICEAVSLYRRGELTSYGSRYACHALAAGRHLDEIELRFNKIKIDACVTQLAQVEMTFDSNIILKATGFRRLLEESHCIGLVGCYFGLISYLTNWHTNKVKILPLARHCKKSFAAIRVSIQKLLLLKIIYKNDTSVTFL